MSERIKRQARLLTCACVLLTWGMSVGAYASSFNIFGTREEFSSDVQPFPKWTGVLSKDVAHRQTMSALCGASRGVSCPMQRWQAVMDAAKALPEIQQLEVVNKEMNRSAYITDMVNWATNDYWETPYEFFTRDGDCEDYAIVKYMTLKALGIPTDTMRILILQDQNLNLMHSILIVRIDDTNYVLDNQIAQLVRDSDIHHYVPIYSINEQGWWRHMPR